MEPVETGPQVTEIRLAAFGDTQAIYTFDYQTVSLERGCRDDWPDSPPNAWVSLLTSVTLPDQSLWHMVEAVLVLIPIGLQIVGLLS